MGAGAPAAELGRPLPWRRGALAAGAVLAEYLAISFFFDAYTLRDRIGWLSHSGDAAPLAFVALTAILALGKAPDRATLDRLSGQLHPLPDMRVWGAAHAVAAAGLF